MSTLPTSPKRLAPIAGLLYLAVAVLGGPPQLLVRPMVRVSADPAATAEAVAANQTLLRIAFVSELAGIVAFILLVMVLYRLLRHVDRQTAAAMVTFVAIAVAILSVNMINHLAALVVSDPSLAAALGMPGTEGLVLLFLELHEVGYSIGEVFFGLWLLPLGYLALRSGWFPRPLAVLLMVGCFAYLALAFAIPLFDGLPEALVWVVATPAGAAEFWMIGYLLTRGVNTTDEQLPTPIAA
jgi:hypothetical protein